MLAYSKKIAIFCGSHTGNNPLFSEAAKQLAILMAHAGITLVYGGAKVGLMGVLADEMLKNNGYVIGIMPKSLVDVEIAHQYLTELRVVDSMHERKAMLAELADGFMMLPGGPGSLDEFFEMFTWAQLGYHSKPCSILNICNYYDHLLKFLDQATEQGFMKQVYRDMIIVEDSPGILLQKINNYRAPAEKKWIKNLNSLSPLSQKEIDA